jgi:hypothetical protein
MINLNQDTYQNQVTDYYSIFPPHLIQVFADKGGKYECRKLEGARL